MDCRASKGERLFLVAGGVEAGARLEDLGLIPGGKGVLGFNGAGSAYCTNGVSKLSFLLFSATCGRKVSSCGRTDAALAVMGSRGREADGL